MAATAELGFLRVSPFAPLPPPAGNVVAAAAALPPVRLKLDWADRDVPRAFASEKFLLDVAGTLFSDGLL
jgi:hypothetical protein